MNSKTPKLILMRHGQSIWNQKNLFTGWVDVPLSEQGIQEAINGGKKIASLSIDVVFTSTLARAQMTAMLALLHHQSGKIPVFVPQEGVDRSAWAEIHNPEAKQGTWQVFRAWELNERMYGKLQGFNKKEMADKYGASLIQEWRRSYDTAPPEGESLAMTVARTMPYFEKKILPCLQQGKNVFVAAHGNSLRGIVMHIEKLSKEEVVSLEIPTGEPLIYIYDKGQWRKE